MRRFFLVAVVLTAGGSLSATAQTTWRGLRFGMTELEAKAQLGLSSDAKRPKLEEESILEQQSPIYAGWMIPVEIEGIPGEAEIVFEKKTHKCSGVNLFLEPLKISSEIERAASILLLFEALENKYGNPFRSKDGVPGQGSKTITWRLDDQIIQCHVTAVANVVHSIMIFYTLKTKDL